MAYYLVVRKDQKPVLLYNSNTSTGTVSPSTSTPSITQPNDSTEKVATPDVRKRKVNKSFSVTVGPDGKVLSPEDPKARATLPSRHPNGNTSIPRILRRITRSSVSPKENVLPPADLKGTETPRINRKGNTTGKIPPPLHKKIAIPNVEQKGNTDCSADPKVLLPPDPKGTGVPQVNRKENPDCKVDSLPLDPQATALPRVEPKANTSTHCPVDLKGKVLTLVPPTSVSPTGKSLALDPKGTALPDVGLVQNTQSWVDLTQKILAVLSSAGTPIDLNRKIIAVVHPQKIVKSPVNLPERKACIPIHSKTRTTPRLLMPKGDLPPLLNPIVRHTEPVTAEVTAKTDSGKDQAIAPPLAKEPKTDIATQEEHQKITPPEHDKFVTRTPLEQEEHLKETPKQEEIVTVMSPELLEPLKKLLPTTFPYKITALEGRSPHSFQAHIRAGMRTEKDTLSWLEEYQKITNTAWRVNRTYLHDGCRVVFKKRYHCYRNGQIARTNYHETNTMTDRPRSKNVNCQARVTITIKNYDAKRPKDKLLKTFPAEIKLQHVHNHQLNDSSLVRRPVDVAVRDKLGTLFEAGHSQTSAYKTFKFDLQLQHGKDYPAVAADSLQCPTLRDTGYLVDVFRLRKGYGKEKTIKGFYMFESLPSLLEKYNERNGGKCAAMAQIGKDVILAACSPLMKKIHRYLPTSGESCLMWSSGRVYRYNVKVFILLTPSPAGPLPLGMLLVTSDSEEVLNKALDEYHSLLGDWAYHKRGKKGPAVIITDDTPNEKNNFKAMYCSAKHYLNVDHVLKEFWRYVIDYKNGVSDPSDRIEIFRVFKSLVEWPQESTFKDQVRIALNYSVLVKYRSIANHLEEHWIPRAGEWAMCKRAQSLKTINNYNDIMMKLLSRTYTFTVVPLFDFMINHFEGYFREKLCARLEDRLDNFTLSSNAMSENEQPTLTCEKLSDNIYRVFDGEKGIVNDVNMCVRICTCQVGLTGCQCRHQDAVITEFNLKSVQSVPVCSDRTKSVLRLVVHGDDPSECSTTEVSDTVAAITDEATKSSEVITEEATEFDEARMEKATELDEAITEEDTELDEAITEGGMEFDEAITNEVTEFDTACQEEMTVFHGQTTKFDEALTQEAMEFDEAITEEGAILDESITEDTAVFDAAETTMIQRETPVFDEIMVGETLIDETAVLEPSVPKDAHVLELLRDASSKDSTTEGRSKSDAKSRTMECEIRIQRVFDCLHKKLTFNPALYVPTLEKFLDNFDEASKTDESLIYALASFCQFTGNVEVEVDEIFRQDNSTL